MSRLWAGAAIVGAALAVAGVGGAAEAPPPGALEEAADSFPHREHQGLFPLCQGCHEGVTTGEDELRMPEPSLCGKCHNGVERVRVDWVLPAPVVGPLDFSHANHAESVERDGEAPVRCAQCHVNPSGPSMALVPLDAARCFDCHGSAPDGHYEQGNECAECHRPLAAVDNGDVLFGGYPKPDEHGGREFLLGVHGAEAMESVDRCSTCHVEDQCAGCHVDAGRSPIPQVPRAPADWKIPWIEAEYPKPDSHHSKDFTLSHGRPAPDAPECSTCHTQDDCAACHISPLPRPAEALQERPQVRAPGVGLEDRLPRSHDTPFFLTTHPVLAAAGPEGCASCHTDTYCAECHDAPRSPGYHPPSFGLRHSAAVGTQALECSNCHSRVAFCRECHADLGLEANGRLGAGYHDAEPVWLLRHAVAARQGLEQCTSCHTQSDCLQCHSAVLGAFKVSPHGPDFDPERARAKNPLICRACHLGGNP